MATDIESISLIIQTYFDGLHAGDTNKLAGAFHDVCHLYTVDAGAVRDISREQWFTIVEQRPKPASMNIRRTDRIISIDFAGPETAMAKVECSIHPRYFTDYLVFLKTADAGWKIVSKTYRAEVKP